MVIVRPGGRRAGYLGRCSTVGDGPSGDPSLARRECQTVRAAESPERVTAKWPSIDTKADRHIHPKQQKIFRIGELAALEDGDLKPLWEAVSILINLPLLYEQLRAGIRNEVDDLARRLKP